MRGSQGLVAPLRGTYAAAGFGIALQEKERIFRAATIYEISEVGGSSAVHKG